MYDWTPRTSWSERLCGWLLPALIVVCLAILVVARLRGGR